MEEHRLYHAAAAAVDRLSALVSRFSFLEAIPDSRLFVRARQSVFTLDRQAARYRCERSVGAGRSFPGRKCRKSPLEFPMAGLYSLGSVVYSYGQGPSVLGADTGQVYRIQNRRLLQHRGPWQHRTH